MLKSGFRKNLLWASVAAMLSYAFVAHAQSGSATASASTLNKADQKIVIDMAQANMAEIAIAKLAQSKSQNDQVKSFAQKMIDDHTGALNDVTTLAQSKGLTLPSTIDSKHKTVESHLNSLSGDAFDRAYMTQAGVQDHQQVHSALKAAAAKAHDADVKALANKMLPVVEQHLTLAQQWSTSSGKAAAR